MYKSYKFRLYPDNKQKILINKTFGCMRFVYNHYLSDISKNGYKNSYACIKDYTSNLKYLNPFLRSLSKSTVFVELPKFPVLIGGSLRRALSASIGHVPRISS